MVQHMEAVHPKGRSRVRARRGGLSRDGGIDIAPSREKPVPGDTITTAGEDRIGIFQVKSSQSLFKSYDIDSGISLRLRTLCRAYQRMKWLQCQIRVVPQAPVTTKGGYVCGFIRDPDDGAVTAQELSAAQSAITKKWYETAIVNMPRNVISEWYFTSEGDERRTSSPGKFWVISEGAPSDSIDVIVTINWRVSLTQPTVERVSDYSFTSNFQLHPDLGKSTLRAYYNNVYTADFSSFVPDYIKTLNAKSAFRVPSFNVEYAEGTGDTGTIQCHYVIYDPNDKTMSSSNNAVNSVSAWQSNIATQMLVPCNTLYKFVPWGDSCSVKNF